MWFGEAAFPISALSQTFGGRAAPVVVFLKDVAVDGW